MEIDLTAEGGDWDAMRVKAPGVEAPDQVRKIPVGSEGGRRTKGDGISKKKIRGRPWGVCAEDTADERGGDAAFRLDEGGLVLQLGADFCPNEFAVNLRRNFHLNSGPAGEIGLEYGGLGLLTESRERAGGDQCLGGLEGEFVQRNLEGQDCPNLF